MLCSENSLQKMSPPCTPQHTHTNVAVKSHSLGIAFQAARTGYIAGFQPRQARQHEQLGKKSNFHTE